MPLRPGELLGLPPGVPDVLGQLPAFRYLLIALALAWALAVARTRPWLGLLAGLLFFEVAAGFWVFGLGRPYGLLSDPAATRRAAEIGVAGAVGGVEGFVVDVPAPGWWSVRLAAAGVPPSWLLLGPTFLPLLVPALMALGVHGLVRPREEGARAALLWLAFGTGDLDALRGLGLLPGLWPRPASAALLATATIALLLALRAQRAQRLWPLAAALLVAASAFVPGPTSVGLGTALLALTLDQSIWLLLGGYGLAHGAGAAARTLVAAGALTVALCAVLPVLGLDAWFGHALYRLGLILAAAGPVGELCARVRKPERLGLAIVLASTVPGAFVTWWEPPSLDPVADESRSPLSPALTDAMAWIRRETPRESVFVASPAHAAAIAALGGRRVLRAPALVATPDDGERWALEQNLLEGHVPRRALPRYGVSHLFVIPGDYVDRGLAGPEVLDRAPHVRLLYRNVEGYRVYEVVPLPAHQAGIEWAPACPRTGRRVAAAWVWWAMATGAATSPATCISWASSPPSARPTPRRRPPPRPPCPACAPAAASRTS
jgi:hypothetical protein